MLDKLRTPFFIIALVLVVCVVLIEMGSSVFLLSNSPKPTPGYGIPYLAVLDGLLAMTIVLFGVPLVISERLHGKIQGILVFLITLFVIIGTIMMILMAIVELMIMIILLTTPIFGTIAYFAIYGDFNTGGAAITLSLIMVLKIAFAWCLFLAHQRFLQNKGLVLIVLTSFLANIVISFLHGLVPGFLVSITDVIGGIVVGILAVIWGIFFLISSIMSMVKAL